MAVVQGESGADRGLPLIHHDNIVESIVVVVQGIIRSTTIMKEKQIKDMLVKYFDFYVR